MYQDGMEKLKENQDRGVSLVVTLCVSAFFVAFAAAILYTAGLLTSQSTRRLTEERCYLMAKSYAEALDDALQNPPVEGGTDKSFYTFVNSFLESNQYVDENPYQFVIGDASKAELKKDGYGDVSLRITLTKSQNTEEGGADQMSGEIEVSGNGGNYAAIIESLEKMTVRQYLVDVKVTAGYGDLTYAYTTEYTREEQYPLLFSHNGNDIVWDGNTWRRGSTSGDEYTPDSGVIQYRFDTTRPTSTRFIENVYTDTTETEGGGTDGGN